MSFEYETTTILGKNQGLETVVSMNNYNEFVIGEDNPRKEVRSLYGFVNFGYKDY